mmetsp:Transcript_7433/g.12250  ORF Transcript_7433/g.12250 Transcript_7433/m.12250 type:complete len:241 (-) Transcript_7433:44-766(-)
MNPSSMAQEGSDYNNINFIGKRCEVERSFLFYLANKCLLLFAGFVVLDAFLFILIIATCDWEDDGWALVVFTAAASVVQYVISTLTLWFVNVKVEKHLCLFSHHVRSLLLAEQTGSVHEFFVNSRKPGQIPTCLAYVRVSKTLPNFTAGYMLWKTISLSLLPMVGVFFWLMTPTMYKLDNCSTSNGWITMYMLWEFWGSYCMPGTKAWEGTHHVDIELREWCDPAPKQTYIGVGAGGAAA